MEKNEQMPLVSVIMPAYNAAAFIEEAIQSVISQTITDWELLVIDDCSTDATAGIVEKMALRDCRVQLLVNETNLGAAGSRNRGLTIFRGKYVALLDSDDIPFFILDCFVESNFGSTGHLCFVGKINFVIICGFLFTPVVPVLFK